MAIYREDIVNIELQSGTLHRSFLNHAIGKGDNMENRFGVRLYRNGEPETLQLATCEGYFRAPNGQNILINGAGYTGVTGNTAWVQLPQACYNEEGQFTLSIKVVDNSVTGTMRIIDGVVNNTGVDSAVAPTGTVPTYQEVLSVYNQVLTNYPNYIKDYPTIIHPTTYEGNLPDADNAEKNTVYRLIFNQVGDRDITAHLPHARWMTTKPAVLIDFAAPSSNQYRVQMFFEEGCIYMRNYLTSYSTWNAWECVAGKYLIEVDVSHPGYRDYDSLIEAIAFCYNKKNMKVIVHPGKYDIISELDSFYGENYLDNLTQRWNGSGYLGYGIHVVFAEGAEVVCEYTGSNSYARQYYSPFNSVEGGFTLENANIRCAGVRYCVHDERSDAADVYQNYYLNCDMYKDSENGAIQQQCIGGGLGKNGQIIIKDCFFDGDMTANPQNLVSYHNSSSGSAYNKVVVSGNYFKNKGRLRIAHYGPATKKTKCIVSNNSFGSEIQVAYESESYHVENMELIDWNNVIRS